MRLSLSDSLSYAVNFYGGQIAYFLIVLNIFPVFPEIFRIAPYQSKQLTSGQGIRHS